MGEEQTAVPQDQVRILKIAEEEEERRQLAMWVRS
jgi:hypothetical protein